jgi:Heterokaryon incompatibility protein (HET)
MPRKNGARFLQGVFKHKRLCYKRNEIRLLNVKPAKTVRDAVHCTIKVVPLDRSPSYEAVSYAWGNTSQLRPIGMNGGKRMLVSKSLESALRYLRHSDKERLLWVDAVCIDQKNILERNRTVSKMHLIYRHADRVIVWLGSPCRPWSFEPLLGPLDEGKRFEDAFYFAWRSQIATKPHRNARAIIGLSKLPWFFRGWVVQETCYAKEIQTQYGKHTIPWHQLEEMVEHLQLTGRETMSGRMRPEGRLLLNLMRIMSSLHDLREQCNKHQLMSLGDMLSFARTRITSDPRDRVFAFVNMLSSIPHSLQPDYTRSTAGIFREASRLLLEKEIGLRTLAECEAETSTGAATGKPRMPSWLPDWSYTRRCEPLPGGLSKVYIGDSYSAGSKRDGSFVSSAGSAVLIVQGFVFDEIIFLQPRGQDFLSDAAMLSSLWTKIDSIPREAVAVSPLSTFSSFHCAAFNDHVSRMEHLDRTQEGRKTDDLAEMSPARSLENLRRVDGRITLLTSKGHMGWAAPAAEIGDKVIVFPGCHVPIIVREVHIQEIKDANTVCTHDAENCGLAACQEKGQRFYRVIGEAC